MAHATRDQRPILPELYLSIVAWMTRATREHRLFQVPGWQPIRNGALVAAAILYGSGVGALWWAGNDADNFGLFGAMFWNERNIDQGLIRLAWTASLKSVLRRSRREKSYEILASTIVVYPRLDFVSQMALRLRRYHHWQPGSPSGTPGGPSRSTNMLAILLTDVQKHRVG